MSDIQSNSIAPNLHYLVRARLARQAAENDFCRSHAIDTAAEFLAECASLEEFTAMVFDCGYVSALLDGPDLRNITDEKIGAYFEERRNRDGRAR